MQKEKNQKGFISTILLIIVALVVLKYFFNISLKDLFNSEIVQDVWFIIKQLFVLLWEAVLTTLDYIKIALVKIKEFIETLPQSNTK